jgi:cytochrome oxidase Cu insertion factor (SCO1/SenC/PrrC family)
MSNEKKARGSRKTLWLIAAVCIAPFIGSLAAYHLFPPKGRVNYGQLLESGRLPAATLPLVDGSDFSFARLQGKWLFVIVDDAVCNAYCERKLWQIRQVRKTQGKYPERIERVWLVTGEGEPSARLRSEYEGTWMVRARQGAILAAFPYERTREDHVYLVDPLGNLVLRYPRDADPSRMRKDLERLLKVSRIG